MSHYMTRVTVVVNGDGNVQLNGGDSVAVQSVIVANTSAAPVDQTFTQGTVKGDGTSLVGTIVVPANDSEAWYPSAIFDTGFRIPEPVADVTVTVTWRPGV